MVNSGGQAELDGMMPVIYDELRRLATSCLNRERHGHTLQPTALVNEVYLRLRGQRHVDWGNRAQFMGIAARMMRRVLVDHWSHRHAGKSVEGGERVPLEDAARITGGSTVDIIDMDRALAALAEVDAQQARIVEMRFFGGLTIAEAAEALGLSTATVEREWSTARLWLAHHMDRQERA